MPLFGLPPWLALSSFLGLPPEVLSRLLLGGAILGGAAMCFFGTRLFKVALGIGGFTFGLVVAAYVVWKQTASVDEVNAAVTYPDTIAAILDASNPTVIAVCAGAGAVAGAVLSVLMHEVGIFVLGAWLGALFVNTTMVSASADAHLIVLAILGLIGGVLALMIRETIVVLSTALNGALALMFGIYALFKQYTPEEAVLELKGFGNDAYVILGCTVILASVGVYVQLSTMPQEKDDPVYKRVNKKKGG